ncbi:DUF2284 domain-containing protein [Chloroflexota bacterium]
MVRKITEHIPNEILQQDLEKYRQRAIEIVAQDAKIIPTDMILIDERVRAKCINPKCHVYGTCANCPPYGLDIDFIRKLVNNYHYAIFTMFSIPPEEITGKTDADTKERIRSQIKNHEMISKLEAEAFYDGYHLAVGFAGGSCKELFCSTQECTALIRGQGCRHRLRARPSMEGVGMNAMTMAASVGWDVYPVGKATTASEVAHGVRLGIVLIY